jgi:hypothetical protein
VQPRTALQQSHFENLSIIENSLIKLGMEVKNLCSALATDKKEKIRLERLLWEEHQQAQKIKQMLFESSSALGEAVEGCGSLSEQVPLRSPLPVCPFLFTLVDLL